MAKLTRRYGGTPTIREFREFCLQDINGERHDIYGYEDESGWHGYRIGDPIQFPITWLRGFYFLCDVTPENK